ncbi:MAG: hypothetical protein AAF806_25510 [Bacteroidota bacterium]
MKYIFLLFIISFGSHAQKTSTIKFKNNNAETNLLENPLRKFVGEWTLKENKWSQNWGGNDEEIEILQHHTLSSAINTSHSLLSIIDGPAPNGHILWTYNPIKKEIHHLSSFGTSRIGVGKGGVNENGDLRLKISFEGEQQGTYRIYTYKWISDNEYELKSVQFDATGQPTGLYYGGTFIRINQKENRDLQEIKRILSRLDDNEATMDLKMNDWVEDLVHMAPDNPAITSKKDLKAYLVEQKKYGYSDMEHQIIEYNSYDDIVVMRGQVIGTFFPSDGGKSFEFETKNLFIFRRVADGLKIWKVIYNMSPNN